MGHKIKKKTKMEAFFISLLVQTPLKVIFFAVFLMLGKDICVSNFLFRNDSQLIV